MNTMAPLLGRHQKEIVGVLSCWDRVIVHGTLPGFGHSAKMTSYLKAHGIRSSDDTKFLGAVARSNPEVTLKSWAFQPNFKVVQ